MRLTMWKAGTSATRLLVHADGSIRASEETSVSEFLHSCLRWKYEGRTEVSDNAATDFQLLIMQRATGLVNG